MEYKEYNTTLNNLNAYLDEYGVAVIPNVLTERICLQQIFTLKNNNIVDDNIVDDNIL
jgi:hypothetical protein